MFIQASIGRNVGTAPMSDVAWATFQNDVRDEIYFAVANGTQHHIPLGDFQVHTGRGEWDGVPEESAHVSVYFDFPESGPALDGTTAWITKELSERFSYLAFQYGQDAVAFVVTDSHLANAR